MLRSSLSASALIHPSFLACRQPSWLRHLSLLLAFCCFWSFAGAGIAIAATPQQNKQNQTKTIPSAFPKAPAFHVAASPFDRSAPHWVGAPAPQFWAMPKTVAKPDPAASPTRLDEAGRTARHITNPEALAWKTELGTTPAPRRAALLHIWLGEWQLGQNQAPVTARAHFRQAQRLLPYSDRLYGLAAYDSAISLFYEGAYSDAAEAFSSLLPAQTTGPNVLRGYDRRHCSLWLRHAAACAGYHNDHQRLGIPEPRSLDPNCGVASLAACLRALSLPYDKSTLHKAVRVTEEGSTLADLLASGKKLGVSIHAVTADEQGLKRLPKPLVAYVEHDHFVALVRADNAGVSYLCSDCGMWPGGRVNLTWKQWRAVNPGIYAAVAKPGSFNDRLLTALTASPTAKTSSTPLQVSYGGDLQKLHLTERLHFAAALSGLRGHVVRFGFYGYSCGFSVWALHCLECRECCPFDLSLIPDDLWSPRAGDPVNLATGEEEYTPPTDLSVYNPHGPSIRWGRIYNSLRPSGTDYQSDDFGIGWSQPYNIQVSDPGSAQILPQLAQAVASGINTPGTDAPGTGLSWDVLLNGTLVASSANSNGWTVSIANYGQPTVTPSATAAVSTGYEIRYLNTYSHTNQSGYFDVVPAASVAQNRTSSFAPNGAGAPAGSLTWDIVQGSKTIASSTNSNGWTVGVSGNYTSLTGFTVTAPQFAPLGSYTVRGKVGIYPSGTATATAAFSVYAIHYIAVAGTKSVTEANGASFAFTAATVPTAGQPRVQCSVQPGTPALVEWDYAPGVYGGYFTITKPDRTKWITTGFTGQNGAGGNRAFLSQIVDRNGNAVSLVYGGLGTFSLPLLSAITDANGNSLLTIGRSGYAVSSVSDAYGRTVYYQPASGNSSLGHVSQIVPTGTPLASAPDRAAFSYTTVTNPENEPFSSFLHTITVPAPTGSGTSTVTINYANGASNVSSIVDGNGNTKTYIGVNADGTIAGGGRSGAGNYTLVTVANPQGTVLYSSVAGWDSNMNETSRTNGSKDASGHFTTYTSTEVYSDPNNPYRPSDVYDANGSNGVPSGTGPWVPAGHSATFAAGSMSSVYDPTWQIFLNSVSVATGEAPNGWTASYNSTAGTFTVSAPAGAALSTGYQLQYRTNGSYGPWTTFTVISGGTKPATHSTWDQYGHLLTQISPRGTLTTYHYDPTNFAMGELQWVQQGSKSLTTYAYYEPSGLTQTVTAPKPGTVGQTGSSNQVTVNYTYDSLGNPLTVTAPGNNAASAITTTFNYTTDGAYSQSAAIGQPLTVTNNLGKVTHLRYDAQGNTTAVKDALGNETDLSYTIRNEDLQTILPATGQTGPGHAGSQAAYLYAEPSIFATAQWPAVTLQYGPQATTTSYDESGNAIRQVVNTYGAEGELLNVHGSTEPVTYAYDALYRLKTLTDGGNHTTSYFYNTAGYLYQTVYPGAQATPPTAPLTAGSRDTTTYTSYDADGNLLQRVDGNNVTTNYSYNDVESRLTDIFYPGSTIGVVHLSYDAYGRRGNTSPGVAGLNDGTGSQAYAYDDDNNLTSKIVTWAGVSGSKTISYGFYPNGSRQSMTADGHSFAYSYDGVGRMSSLSNDGTTQATYAYQDNGWLQTKTLGNTDVTTYTRDQQGRLRELANKTSGGANLSDFTVPATGGYDGVGNRLTQTATIPNCGAGYSGTTHYQYDYGQSVNPQLNRSQISQATSTTATGTENYLYDQTGHGQPASSTGPGNATSFFEGADQFYNADNQLTGAVYDGNGNPTSYHTPGLTYDPENRLTAYSSTQTDGWNGDGLRAWKQTGAASTRTYFLYDGTDPVGEYNSTGTLHASNVFGADGLISRLDPTSPVNTGRTYYSYDLHGNVAERLYANGNSYQADLYFANGYRSERLLDYSDPWGYGAQAGYFTDLETGLILCTHRFYDPNVGRFVTRDPMGYAGGVNLYAYCQNDPVNEIDPLGFGYDGTTDPYIDADLKCFFATVGFVRSIASPRELAGWVWGIMECIKALDECYYYWKERYRPPLVDQIPGQPRGHMGPAGDPTILSFPL